MIITAEIIQEMIDLAKEIKEADKRHEKMGLSRDELAFYDTVSNNQSAIVYAKSLLLCVRAWSVSC